MNSNPANVHDETIDRIVRSQRATNDIGPRFLAMSPAFERELIIQASSCCVACEPNERTFRGIPYAVIYSQGMWIVAID